MIKKKFTPTQEILKTSNTVIVYYNNLNRSTTSNTNHHKQMLTVLFSARISVKIKLFLCMNMTNISIIANLFTHKWYLRIWPGHVLVLTWIYKT